jgi:uracil-DNA glycosylase family 4
LTPPVSETPAKPVSDWSARDLRALLDWYAAAGVDTALAEDPIDRTAKPKPVEPPPVPRAEPTQPSFAAMSATTADESERAAQAAASAAQTMDELREALSRFEGCNLRHTATKLVFADGNPEARVMFIGEAPGRDEDIQGLPFVGRAGKLLDRMLAAIGLSRDDVYIANIVPWRPPGNRTPTPQETAACRPFIARQIELCDPDFLICLGNPSARELLHTTEGILRAHGRWLTYDNGGKTIRAMAMLHPAYLLRQPLHKRLAWRDMMALAQALEEKT